TSRLRLSFLYRYGDHRKLPSFPTRRSSDLKRRVLRQRLGRQVEQPGRHHTAASPDLGDGRQIEVVLIMLRIAERGRLGVGRVVRSEEHTSELQSLRHLVCRLLLEKKKIQHC